jgi:chemotaxis protein histidine kinase CheA
MNEAHSTRPAGPVSLADRLLALAKLIPAAPDQRDRSAGLSESKRQIEALKTELEDLGLPRASSALVRLGVLTEVWECLVADGAVSAGEVGHFCVEAVRRLARCGEPGADHEETADRILEQSSSSWGDYLALLESPSPVVDETEEVPGPEPEPETEPETEPAPIDSAALLRLFTGMAGPGSPAVSGSKEPERSIPPARPAVRGVTISPPPAPSGPAGQPGDPLVIPALPPRVDLDDELRRAFLGDAIELFERIEPLVLGLGRGAHDGETLSALGRCLHTLKGAAGSVGIGELAALIHQLEEGIEAAGVRASVDLIDALHKTLGYLEGLLEWLGSGSVPGSGERRIETDAEPETTPIPEDDRSLRPDREASSVPRAVQPPDAPAKSEATPDGLIRLPASRFDDLVDLVSELIARRGLWSAPAESLKSIESTARGCRQRMTGILDRLHDTGLARPAGPDPNPPASDTAAQLRRLGELADDLTVLAEMARASCGPLTDHGQSMARLSIQLWDELQSVRMVPIRILFQRLIRVAHDAARVEGRQVEVVMAGDESGVERALQDKLFEPLLHVVRNAVAHGIEPSEERLRSGKPAAGIIKLEASREGNTLVISVSDDGKGLDHDAIAAKARRLGLLTPGEHPGLERLNSLIFHPGFSTREQASTISGRGVGMDVVAREVGLLRGLIGLETGPGRGTRLTIRLPARLALETTMIVRVAGQAFAVPMSQIDSVQELQAAGGGQNPASRVPKPEDSSIDRHPRIPIIPASQILGIPATDPPACPRLLVARTGGGPVGLSVDSMDGTEELVIKPLCGLLAGHPWVSGTSQSLSGEVTLVLNLTGLHRCLGATRRDDPNGGQPLHRKARGGGKVVLLVDDSLSVRKSVARQLRLMGWEVDEVSDGLEALGRLRGRNYALVVTDLEMPRLDGFGLLAELRRSGPLPVPIVVASTRADPETRRRVAELGARAFLPKPVDPHALTAAIGPLFEHGGG